MENENNVVNLEPAPVQETSTSRWRSKLLWASIVAQIVSILIMVGVIDTGLGETINQIASGVLQILTLLGVINNPTVRGQW